MLLPADVPSSFVTSGNSPSLFVGMSIYDNSGSNPVLVQGPTRMTNFAGNAYQAKYTPPVGNFLVLMAIYTDSSLTTLMPGFEQDVQAVTAFSLAFNIPVTSVVGYVDTTQNVEGVVNC